MVTSLILDPNDRGVVHVDVACPDLGGLVLYAEALSGHSVDTLADLEQAAADLGLLVLPGTCADLSPCSSCAPRSSHRHAA